MRISLFQCIQIQCPWVWCSKPPSCWMIPTRQSVGWADLDTAMVIRANNNDRNHKYDVSFVHDSRKCEHREHTNLHDCFYGVIQADLCLFILSPGEVSWEKIPVPKLWVETKAARNVPRPGARWCAAWQGQWQWTSYNSHSVVLMHYLVVTSLQKRLLAFCSPAPIPSQEYKLFR